MLKRDELTNPDSCLNRAREDEHLFVLLGRDPAMPATIRHWIDQRLRLNKNGPDDPQIAEAEALARTLSGIVPRDLSWAGMARLLLARAQRMLHQEDSYDDKLRAAHCDNAELIRVLARILEGRSIPDAFGAPGNWGYDTPIGDALAATYRGGAR